MAVFRNPDLDRDGGDAEALFELGRSASVQVALGALSEPDVASYIDLAAHVTAERFVVEAIFRETEGNPLFVCEVVRLLAEEGRLYRRPDPSWRLSVPQGVLEVIARRVQRLSPACMEALVLASVLGREFRLDALARLSGRSANDLLELLDEAVGERMVTAADGMPLRLRFAHALIRDALYESLPPGRQIDLHRRAGEALEDLYAADLDPHLAEIAHHFLVAAPAADAEKAVDFARRAGDRASRLLAREEAARLYELALAALPVDREAGMCSSAAYSLRWGAHVPEPASPPRQESRSCALQTSRVATVTPRGWRRRLLGTAAEWCGAAPGEIRSSFPCSRRR